MMPKRAGSDISSRASARSSVRRIARGSSVQACANSSTRSVRSRTSTKALSARVNSTRVGSTWRSSLCATALTAASEARKTGRMKRGSRQAASITRGSVASTKTTAGRWRPSARIWVSREASMSYIGLLLPRRPAPAGGWTATAVDIYLTPKVAFFAELGKDVVTRPVPGQPALRRRRRPSPKGWRACADGRPDGVGALAAGRCRRPAAAPDEREALL